MSLEFLRASEAEDPSQRFKLVAYIEVKNDEHGYPKPGKQVQDENSPMKNRAELNELLGYLKSNREVAQAKVEAELRRPTYAIDNIAVNRGNEEVAVIGAKIDLLEWVLS